MMLSSASSLALVLKHLKNFYKKITQVVPPPPLCIQKLLKLQDQSRLIDPFFSSCRTGQMYYMFGFVSLAFIILMVVCAETSILLCYFHLCTEDYRWWWRSFFSTGTTSFYFLLFSLHYFFKAQITGSLSMLLFFGYTAIIVFLFFIFAGKGNGS